MTARVLDWRGIIAGLAITAGAASCGAAIDVRDRVAKCEAETSKAAAVQAERDDKILGRLNELRDDFKQLRADMGKP